MTQTRLYRDGRLERTDFPLAQVAGLAADPAATVWVDVEQPTAADLAEIARDLCLHPLAVEDAVHAHQRPKLDRYASHLFIAAYAFDVRDDADGTRSIRPLEVCAFLTDRVLVTVRKTPGFPVGDLVARWDAQPGLASAGPAFLLWGLLDLIVDTQFDAAQGLDDEIDELEDAVLAENPDVRLVQRRTFRLRKQILYLRRYAVPLREVAQRLARADAPQLSHARALAPYFEDVYDHTLRVADQTDSLRGIVDTVVDTNLTNQSNRMNLVMKKVTSWAAIIAVPSLVTGYFGQNLTFPLINTVAGWWVSNTLLIVFSALLYVQFKRRDWL